MILGTGARTVQAKRYGLIRDQLQIAGIDLDGRTFFGAARDEAQSPELIAIAAESDEVSARQTAANEQSLAGRADVGIIRRADGYREIQIAIVEDQRTAAIPMFQHIGDALAQDVGDEEAAVEENRVGNGIAGAGKETRPDDG